MSMRVSGVYMCVCVCIRCVHVCMCISGVYKSECVSLVCVCACVSGVFMCVSDVRMCVSDVCVCLSVCVLPQCVASCSDDLHHNVAALLHRSYY